MWRAFLHVSFPHSRPFGHLGQTHNLFGITPFGPRWTPFGIRSEKFSFFHNTRWNRQTKPIDLLDGPTMSDEMDRPSQLDLTNEQIHPVKSSRFLTCVVNHAWCLSTSLNDWCLSANLDNWCLSDELDTIYTQKSISINYYTQSQTLTS